MRERKTIKKRKRQQGERERKKETSKKMRKKSTEIGKIKLWLSWWINTGTEWYKKERKNEIKATEKTEEKKREI